MPPKPSTCHACGGQWSGHRAGHCTRCHRTFNSDEAFYAHLETRTGSDPETGASIYEVAACADPGSLLDKNDRPRFTAVMNAHGTMSWKTRLTAEDKARLAKLGKKSRT